MNAFRSIKITVFSGVILLLLLQGCTQEGNSLKEPVNSLTNLKPDTTGRKAISILETRLEERRVAGDTLIADAQKLKAVLTDSIPGFRLEVVEADTVTMPLSEMVEVRKVFYNTTGDYIELSIGDYVDDPDFLRLSWQQHNLADSVPVAGVTEDRREITGLMPSSYPACCTWSTFSVKDGNSSVHFIIDGRYYVAVNRPLQKAMLDLSQVRLWLNWEALK